MAKADVIVENFKPGTIERLGFGYKAMKAIKPDLVYASILALAKPVLGQVCLPSTEPFRPIPA